MTGAESLIRTLIDARLDVCFANPGTTEMPLVPALDEVPGMRAGLCLFEGVCTGAADGIVLTQPSIDWVTLATGMGVPGARVETAETLAHELGRARAHGGPPVSEAVL